MGRNRVHVAKRLGAFEAKRGCDLIRIQDVRIVSDEHLSKTTCLNSKGSGVSSSYSVCCSGVVLYGEDVSLPSQRYGGGPRMRVLIDKSFTKIPKMVLFGLVHVLSSYSDTLLGKNPKIADF